MLKTKKSKFIVFTCLSIAVLASFSPLLINYDDFFGYKWIKNQTIDGVVNVHVTLNVELDTSVQVSVYYRYYMEIDLTYNSSVTVVEIERVNYQIYHNMDIEFSYNGIYYQNIIITRGIILLFGDNLTCQGSVDLSYQLNSNPQNDTVNYNLVYNLNIRGEDAQMFFFLKDFLNIVYIASFVVIPVFLFFTMHPEFYEPSNEEKEENAEFFDKVAKVNQKKRKKRNKSSTKS